MLCVMNVPFLSGEYWYGGASHDGVKMPIGANDCYEIDCTKNETPNQMMPPCSCPPKGAASGRGRAFTSGLTAVNMNFPARAARPSQIALCWAMHFWWRPFSSRVKPSAAYTFHAACGKRRRGRCKAQVNGMFLQLRTACPLCCGAAKRTPERLGLEKELAGMIQ